MFDAIAFVQEESAAERRARLAIAKTRSKEDQRLKDLNFKAANILMARLSPAVASLQSLLGAENIEFVAKPIREPVEVACSRFVALEQTCREVVAAGGVSKEPLPDSRSVSSQIAGACNAAPLVTQMLATIAKAST